MNKDEDVRTEQDALVAVQKDGKVLEHVPEKLKTPVVCETAVRQDVNAFPFVPEDLKTPKLCAEAVRMNGCAFMGVPEALRMEELTAPWPKCVSAVRKMLMAVPPGSEGLPAWPAGPMSEE